MKDRTGAPDQAKSLDDFPYFDTIKMNIEAWEYPAWLDMLVGSNPSNSEVNRLLRGTHHIHYEMHRLGMQGHGLSYASMLFGELLFAAFFSAGYHPFATEKWHDSTAAQDVSLVNQTWWLRSELDQLVAAWKEDPHKPGEALAPHRRSAEDEAARRKEAEEVFAPASLCTTSFCNKVRGQGARVVDSAKYEL